MKKRDHMLGYAQPVDMGTPWEDLPQQRHARAVEQLVEAMKMLDEQPVPDAIFCSPYQLVAMRSVADEGRKRYVVEITAIKILEAQRRIKEIMGVDEQGVDIP